MANPRTAAEWLLATVCSSPALSRAAGRLSDLRLPPPVMGRLVRAYARVYGVDLEECAERPESYRCFNAFFTRALADGRRCVSREQGVVVSPCDARVSAIGGVPADGRLEQVKGRAYSIEALLGSDSDAAPFAGGTYATLYLSPSMYHRVHSPLDGHILAWRYVAGRLFPVNGPGVRSIPGLFTRNERVALFYETEDHGRAALVLVGAANVGRMSLAFAELVTNRGACAQRFEPKQPVAVARGDEIGAFNLGSTVVLLLEDRALLPVAERGEVVRMGQPLWRRS
jgi:phosphatidylserine decarboxylase